MVRMVNGAFFEVQRFLAAKAPSAVKTTQERSTRLCKQLLDRGSRQGRVMSLTETRS
jgi:hypothetical protein